MSVKNTHPDYDRMAPKWKRCRDVMAGQDAMRAATIASSVKRMETQTTVEAYIPALKDQTPSDYTSYVCRAPFYNASWRTVSGLNGMLFRKSPTVDVQESVRPLLDDVTLCGEPLEMFAKDVGEECLAVGRVGVLVDYPVAVQLDANGREVQMTQADAERLNLRPTFCTYKAESIINWQERVINNKNVLAQVVLVEQASIREDEFTEKLETQYRVLDLDAMNQYRVRIFRINKTTGLDEQIGNDVYPTMNNARLDYIPFVFLSSDDVTPEVDEPPLIDLVDMNIAHWRSTADYEHGCHFAGLPTPVVSGYTPLKDGEKLYVGSATAWIFPEKEAKATYLEFTGQGLNALKENITDKEQRMAVLGARMLEALKKGIESAQTASIHRVGEQSMLASTSTSISLGLTRALQWFSDWAGANGDASIDLNKDFFPAPMDAQTLSALVSAWQSGAISDQTLFDNLQQAEIQGADATFEEEQARIANSAPRLTPKLVADPFAAPPVGGPAA
jgi:hypothetical protein